MGRGGGRVAARRRGTEGASSWRSRRKGRHSTRCTIYRLVHALLYAVHPLSRPSLSTFTTLPSLVPERSTSRRPRPARSTLLGVNGTYKGDPLACSAVTAVLVLPLYEAIPCSPLPKSRVDDPTACSLVLESDARSTRVAVLKLGSVSCCSRWRSARSKSGLS